MVRVMEGERWREMENMERERDERGRYREMKRGRWRERDGER